MRMNIVENGLPRLTIDKSYHPFIMSYSVEK